MASDHHLWRHIHILLSLSDSMRTALPSIDAGIRTLIAEQASVSGRTTVTIHHLVHGRLITRGWDSSSSARTVKPGKYVTVWKTITRIVSRLIAAAPHNVAQPDERIVILVATGQAPASVPAGISMARQLLANLRATRRPQPRLVLLTLSETVADRALEVGFDPSTILLYESDLLPAALAATGEMIRRGFQTSVFSFSEDERAQACHRPR